MKTFKIAFPILAATILLFISACSSTFSVSADYDKTAAFKEFKTYGFLPGADSTMGPGSMRIKALVKNYMESLDYVYAETPDLYIAINGKVQQRVGASTSPTYGGYGYYGWSDYTTHTYTYNETTVVIDIIAAREHQLVWQGIASGEFDQYKLSDAKLQKMVDEIFGQYPFTAGSNNKRKLLYGKYYEKPAAK